MFLRLPLPPFVAPRVAAAVIVLTTTNLLAHGTASAQQVTEVKSLDTIVIDGVTQVRMLGVAPPSLNTEEEKACAATGRKEVIRLAYGKTVRLVPDPRAETPTPSAWPTLRYVYLPDGQLLNQLILATGCARMADSGKNLSLWPMLSSVHEHAQTTGRGLYAATPATRPPETPSWAPATTQDGPATIAYLITASTIARAEPSASSKQVAALSPFDILLVEKALPGWACGSFTKSVKATAERGCVAAVADNLLQRDPFDALLTIARLSDTTWTTATRIDILRKKIRVGFTAAQVRLALGDPTSVTESETAAGSKEVWVFPGRLVTFSAGKVREIVTTKDGAQ